MAFQSILFADGANSTGMETDAAPAMFGDLNLDQIVNAITARRQEYNLKPFFYTPLHTIDTIKHRQDVARDLENERLLESIRSFAGEMIVMRRYLGLVDNLYNEHHKQGWILEAVDVYCAAVARLVQTLEIAPIQSRGLAEFRDYLQRYVAAPGFTALLAETQARRADLATVKYAIIVKMGSIKVRKYESEIDYTVDVEETFAKFKQGAVKDYRIKLPNGSGMNSVESVILDFVARLYPEVFAALDAYCTQHRDFFDPTIARFDREIQFYVAYLEYIVRLKQAGLAFCYPQMTSTDKEIYSEQGFDLALANQRVAEHAPIVCNDFYLKGAERIFVVSGPNQGGKTTFARAFGQLHYLASLGLPVPGKRARLYLYDHIFTHFEQEEDIANLRGKLQDDLFRIYAILGEATPHSIVIMNEIFTSTTLQDAVFLSKKIMERIIALDLLCVCVTFIEELAALSEKTVSMVGGVVPENPTLRTYKIERRPADGLSYAVSIAEKHHLTYARLKERIAA